MSKLAHIALLYRKYSCLLHWPFFLSCSIVTASLFAYERCQASWLGMSVAVACAHQIARAFTFSSLGAALPFMMFIWCSCSEEMGFICFFSSSLILFLSSASNLLLLSDFPLWAAFYALLLFTGTELQRLWDRIHSLLGQRTETCQPIYLLISERVTNSTLVIADVYYVKML